MASEDSGGVSAEQDGTPVWNADGWDGAMENQTSHTENSDQHLSEEHSVSTDQVPQYLGDDRIDDDDDDGGEYDPESITITTTSTTIAPAPAPAPAPIIERPVSNSPHPAKKPKKGGFIVNSSDEEDDTPTPAPVSAPSHTSTTLKPTPSEAQPQPFSHSPLHQQIATPHEDMSRYSQTQASNGPVATPATSDVATVNATRARLPTDIVGVLEERIKHDPRGDIDAWLMLIDEHKRRYKIEDTRVVYERFLEVFPQAAEIWAGYVEMELSLNNYSEAEGIFRRTLQATPSVQLWTSYLNYVRRRNDLNDTTNRARQIVSQAYEFVLKTIGQDRDAGSIWQDYITFLKTGPGQTGGSGWQDQQKMDLLRKAYQSAISIPMANLNALWKEYDQFEMGLNKMTGRKFLQERSPSYMTARGANTHLENITRGLQRTTLPRLPPAPGFEGDQEYLEQVALWKAWVAWEKDDPLVLKTDGTDTYRQRILHVYKSALMALRFWPEMWVDAAEWCFENNILSQDGQDEGLHFLINGLEANPESTLIALKYADRIESSQPIPENDQEKAALVLQIRAPCDKVLDTLYDMIKKLKDQEAAAVAKIKEDATNENDTTGNADMDDEDEGEIKEKSSVEVATNAKIKFIQDGCAIQIDTLKQHIAHIWVALARSYRRVQGRGRPPKDGPGVGLRGIFMEARQRGNITSAVYTEVSKMEWEIYQEDVATKIFDRGTRLFPEEEQFVVQYLKHLHAKRDFTNARVVFSQTVQRFKQKPELIPRLKPIYAYFHSYEARFGQLSQVKELEAQMMELFPDDPSLSHFAARFSTDKFNPITARVIVSPARQMRPKNIMQSVEQPTFSTRSSPRPAQQVERSPQPQFLPAINSPKRPFQPDDQDEYPPRKLARGASPLKGAAGRRLDQQRRAQGQGTSSRMSAPGRDIKHITFLLSEIPPAGVFGGHRFRTDGMVRLIQNTTVPTEAEWKAQNDWRIQRDAVSSNAHTRHASSEYPSYSYPKRNSPGPSVRPVSPFGGMNRGVVQASAPYRNSPLRPSSSGSYEPPPAVYQTSGTAQFNTPGNAAFPNWPAGYAPPSGYGAAPTQQHTQQQYGGYY